MKKNNFLKECAKTGKRANGYRVIEYWYKGNKNYDAKIGCEGCFWYNPTKWREELNKKIKG